MTGGSLAVLALIAAGMVLARLGPALPTAQRANLWIGTVQRGDLTIHVRADGVLVPKLSRWIAAASGAEVDHILVRPGATVTPDTVLMRLSNPEVQDRLSSAQAGVAEAEADLAAKRTALQSQLLDERAALAAVRAVRAGLAGVVQEIAVQEGQQVATGANLARAADTRSLMARLQGDPVRHPRVGPTASAFNDPPLPHAAGDCHYGFAIGTSRLVSHPALRATLSRPSRTALGRSAAHDLPAADHRRTDSSRREKEEPTQLPPSSREEKQDEHAQL